MSRASGASPVSRGGPPLRVCFLSPDDPSQGVNGPTREAIETARALASAGHDAHVIGHGERESRVRLVDGVWCHQLPLPDRALPGLEGVAVERQLYAAVAKYRELLRLHSQAPVDLVVATLWPGEGLVCLLDERLVTVTRLVTSVRFMIERGMLAGEPFVTMARMERAVLRRSRHISASTAAIVTDTEATFGVALPPCRPVPLATEDRAGGVAGAERLASGDEVEVLLVGRVEPRKGQDVLLAAARSLASSFPQAVYVLAGPGDWEGHRAEIERDGALRGRVHLLGEVAEERLWRLYAGADVVCVPSRYESFGQVLIEAMIFGKPIVASAVGGMPAVVEENGNALLCPPGDAEALAGLLARLIADKVLREAFGRRSRELYEERYTPARLGERASARYRSIIEEHAAARSGAGGPAAEAGADSMRVAGRLAEALEEITGMDERLAGRVAAELLDETPAQAASRAAK